MGVWGLRSSRLVWLPGRQQACDPSAPPAKSHSFFPPHKCSRLIRHAYDGSDLPDFLTSPAFLMCTPLEEFVSVPSALGSTHFRLVLLAQDGWEYTVAERDLSSHPDPAADLMVTVSAVVGHVGGVVGGNSAAHLGCSSTGLLGSAAARATIPATMQQSSAGRPVRHSVSSCQCPCKGGGAQRLHAAHRSGLIPPLPPRLTPGFTPLITQMAEFQSNALDLGDHEVVFNMVSYPTVCVQREVVERMIARCAEDPPA